MSRSPSPVAAAAWPALPLDAWQDTCDTLHMWTQIVGKIRLALAPPENHWWQVAALRHARGLTTSPMPLGARTLRDRLRLHRPPAASRAPATARPAAPAAPPQPVADFYDDYHGGSAAARHRGPHLAGARSRSRTPIPFDEDRAARGLRRRRGAALLARFWCRPTAC